MSLSHEIIYGTQESVERLLQQGADVDEMDIYGFTPLIESAIVRSTPIAEMLLNYGADVDETDVTGRTALHWAATNHDISLSKLLLANKANPNAYTAAGQSILVFPLLRHQQTLKKLLTQHGASLDFAQDFIQAKLLGHRYHLMGQVDIVNPEGRFIEIEYEGFFLEFTLELIRHSLERYQHNFAARHLKNYFNYLDRIIRAFAVASELMRYQKYTIDIREHAKKINTLLDEELLLLPIAYEGHAITLILYGKFLVRCDRGEVGKREGAVVFYRVDKEQLLHHEFLKHLLYKRQSKEFIQEGIKDLLGLEPVLKLSLPLQLIGNCSWANVEASIPAMLCLLMLHQKRKFMGSEVHFLKQAAMAFYQEWIMWDQDRALEETIQSFRHADKARRASKAAMLGAVLFQQCHYLFPKSMERADSILKLLGQTEFEDVLRSYLEIYWKQRRTMAGENLRHLLDLCGVRVVV